MVMMMEEAVLVVVAVIMPVAMIVMRVPMTVMRMLVIVVRVVVRVPVIVVIVSVVVRAVGRRAGHGLMSHRLAPRSMRRAAHQRLGLARGRRQSFRPLAD